MGHSYAPKYRVETDEIAVGQNGALRRCHGSYIWGGVLSRESVTKWREDMNKSFNAGCANGHLVGTRISNVRVINQMQDVVVMEVKAPMFELID